MRGFLAITLPLYVLDQITKIAAFIQLRTDTVEVIPGFFYLELAFNTGAAFGILRDNNLFFIILSCVAAAVLCTLLAGKRLDGPWLRLGSWMLLAGILGNLTDRLWNRAVIDFLAFRFGDYAFPNFNIADSCICIAVGLFFIASFRTPAPVKPKAEPAPEPDPAPPEA